MTRLDASPTDDNLTLLRMFQLEPAAKKMFKFKDGEDIRSNPLFFKHARAMVDMIDCAVGFLGPDLDPLTEDLNALGKRHVSYGVKAAYLPLMGESLYFALSKVLGSKFTSGDQKSWEAVFAFMIDKMVKGMSV